MFNNAIWLTANDAAIMLNVKRKSVMRYAQLFGWKRKQVGQDKLEFIAVPKDRLKRMGINVKPQPWWHRFFKDEDPTLSTVQDHYDYRRKPWSLKTIADQERILSLLWEQQGHVVLEYNGTPYFPRYFLDNAIVFYD